MVARICRLRVALLLSAFRARWVTTLRRIVGGLLAAAVGVALAWFPAWMTGSTGGAALSAHGLEERATVEILLASIVLACAVIIPLFANANHLEPRQFGHLPARPSAIAFALWITTPLTWPFLWLLVWVGSLVFFAPVGDSLWWPYAASMILILLLAMTGARVASALSRLIVSRRAVSALRITGLVLLLAALPVAVFAITQLVRDPSGAVTRDAAEVLGWTPIGAPVKGLALALSGDPQAALMRFGITVAAVIVLLLLWFVLVRYSVEHTARPADTTVARDGLGWFERVSARPAPVIGARALSYWARDPRYRVALAAVPIAPVVMLVALWIAGVGMEGLALVPLPVILLLLGWSLHNDISMDSTAIWMHVASGTRGRHDRLGRLFPILLIGIPTLLIGSSVTVTVVGDWRVLPAVLGMNLGVLLVACGVASVFSAMMPYPATRPGDSPFAQPAIVGAGAGSSQTLSMLLALILCVPPVWVAADALQTVTFGSNAFALVFGAAYGALILFGGVLIGGKIFDRAGPELIAITQTFD